MQAAIVLPAAAQCLKQIQLRERNLPVRFTVTDSAAVAGLHGMEVRLLPQPHPAGAGRELRISGRVGTGVGMPWKRGQAACPGIQRFPDLCGDGGRLVPVGMDPGASWPACCPVVFVRPTGAGHGCSVGHRQAQLAGAKLIPRHNQDHRVRRGGLARAAGLCRYVRFWPEADIGSRRGFPVDQWPASDP